MLLHAFLHGFLLSLGLILPIGIQNGFVLSQGSLHKRWLQALPTVVTASLCDTLLVRCGSLVYRGSGTRPVQYCSREWRDDLWTRARPS